MKLLKAKPFVPIHAQIDLKHCIISVQDGYVGPAGAGEVNLLTGGAVNNSAGYTTGAVTMTVDGFTGAVANGQSFTLTGDVTVYTISAHTETSGNTTSITFAPGLVNAATDNEVITMQYKVGTTTMLTKGFTGAVVTGDQFQLTGDTTVYSITAHSETSSATTSITFTPALTIAASPNEAITFLPHTLVIKLGEGTVSYDEKRTMQYVRDRGLLVSGSVREGDQEPIDVKFDFIWEHLKASGTDTVPTIEDAFKNRGLAANWLSAGADKCEPYALNVIIEFDPPCVGEDKEIITLPEFRYESFNHEAKQGIVTVTGKCKATQASIVRVAA